jgi:heterotetrameric sarcosine oxidase delta subunit
VPVLRPAAGRRVRLLRRGDEATVGLNEFRFQGEVTRRPPPEPTLRALTDYVYFRDNVAGVQREWWQHRTGCGEWFLADRDTRTNEVLEVMLPDPKRPA